MSSFRALSYRSTGWMSSSSYRSTSQRSSPFSSVNCVVAVDCSTAHSNGFALERVSTWSVRSVAKRPSRSSSSRVVRAPYSKRGMNVICIGTRPRVQRRCRWISGCGPDGRPSSSTGMKSVSTTTPSGGAKGRLEDVGAREVALGGGPLALRADRPGAAPLRVEQRGEDAAAVEPGQAAPVDRRRRARPAPRSACRRSGRTPHSVSATGPTRPALSRVRAWHRV